MPCDVANSIIDDSTISQVGILAIGQPELGISYLHWMPLHIRFVTRSRPCVHFEACNKVENDSCIHNMQCSLDVLLCDCAQATLSTFAEKGMRQPDLC